MRAEPWVIRLITLFWRTPSILGARLNPLQSPNVSTRSRALELLRVIRTQAWVPGRTT